MSKIKIMCVCVRERDIVCVRERERGRERERERKKMMTKHFGIQKKLTTLMIKLKGAQLEIGANPSSRTHLTTEILILKFF